MRKHREGYYTEEITILYHSNQDNPITKPRSIVADFNMIIKTIEFALEGEQISPII